MDFISDCIRVEQNNIYIDEKSYSPEVEYTIFAGLENVICGLSFEELKTIGNLIDKVVKNVERRR